MSYDNDKAFDMTLLKQFPNGARAKEIYRSKIQTSRKQFRKKLDGPSKMQEDSLSGGLIRHKGSHIKIEKQNKEFD